jgi:hypothetical protein
VSQPLLSISLHLPGDVVSLPFFLRSLRLLLRELAVEKEQLTQLQRLVIETTGHVATRGVTRPDRQWSLTVLVFAGQLNLQIDAAGNHASDEPDTESADNFCLWLLDWLEPAADCLSYSTRLGDGSRLEAEFYFNAAPEPN